jgi:hypothetical protein
MLVQSALTHPQDGRPVDDLIPEVRANADEFSRVAMELGTAHHNCIEGEVFVIEGLAPGYTLHPDVPPETMAAFREWYKTNGLKCIETERPFACERGYGGCIDWLGTIDGVPFVVDWKTQKTTPGKRVNYYKTWAAQLAAYAYGVGWHIEECQLMSVVISTTEPGRIEHKIWHDNSAWLAAFFAAFNLWKSPLIKNFDPTA